MVERGGGQRVCVCVFLLRVFVACVGGCVAARPSPNLREREHK